MKRNRIIFQIFLTSLLALSLFSCGNQTGNSKLVVGEGGNLKTIVIPDQADEVTWFAASELQRYLEMMTGILLEIEDNSEVTVKSMAIRLNTEANSELKWDGYAVETGGEGIVLSASEPRGLLYGVYTLLEEGGCSFLYPGSQEEIVPRQATVEFRQGSRIFNPLLEHRGITPYGLDASSVELGRSFIDWMAKNRLNLILISEDRPSDCPGPAHGSVWKEVDDELLPELQKRGFVIEMSEHCTHVFFPRSLFEHHPDWFALNDGKRKLGEPPYSGQMCYANQDAVEYYASAVADYAANHPEFHIIGTWPLDGGEYCECEACKDPYTVYNAAVRVAEKVKKVRPDMVVEHLAYKPQTWQPPGGEIPDNLSVLWCPDHGKMDDLAKEWIRKSTLSGGVYKFEYNLADNYRSRANVGLRPDFSADLAKQAQKMGYRGVITLYLSMENWWRSCFNHWFFARACWDQELDVEAGLHETCQKYYGAQATEIEEVFTTIFKELHPEPYFNPIDESFAELSSEVASTAAKILDQINRIITETEDPDINKRVVRLKTYVEFFQLFTESFTSRKTADLDRLVKFSEEHPDQDMVLMYPEYIQWRNGEVFP